MQPAADVAVGQRGDGGLDRRQGEREEVAVRPADGRGVGGRLDRVGGQPVERRRASVTCTARSLDSASTRLENSVVSEVIRTLRSRRRVPVRLGQRGAGPDEVPVVALDDPDLLRGQPGVVAGGVHGVDPGEQPRVEPDGVGVLGDQRCQLGLEGLHLRGRHRRSTGWPRPASSARRSAGPLQRLDGVRERRGSGPGRRSPRPRRAARRRRGRRRDGSARAGSRRRVGTRTAGRWA